MKHLTHTFFALLAFFCTSLSFAQLPDNFFDQVIIGGLNEAIGVEFDTSGRMYIWEKGGVVRIFEDDSLLPTPLIDISEEVGNFGDHGLLGFAVHPDFYENGFFYLYYTVDRHYLMNYGTATYSATTNDYFKATICRLIKYTADAETNFTTAVPGSRAILIGTTKKNGVPVLHDSHAGSPLIFGSDKTLLVITGDGASYNEADNGSESDTYYIDGLADSIIRNKENIGSFRSQLLDCLNGKILRIDPVTGDGISSNPYYNASSPGSIQSKVWALGLRNPFRAESKPGTGSTNPEDADPGTIYIGDVGWNNWEELNICDGPAQNFGWPVYEGMELQVGYDVSSADNRDAPNPLFNGSTCNDKFFDFKHLIVQETLLPPIYSNSCEPLITIPPTINLFQNKRPVMDWAHNAVETRVATFTGTTASWEHIHEAIGGEDFSGAASVGGVWYTGEAYPETYLNTYFHADFAGNWVKNIELTTDNDLVSVNDFFTTPGPVVCMAMNPIDGYIYYVQYPSQVKRFAYSLNENLAPDAVINTDIIYGNSPLIVSFSADNSSDPEGGLLTYEWNIGDGTTTTEKNPTHVFTTSDTEPTVFTVTLSVTDSLGLSSVADTTIFVNNTPPVPTITSISNGDLYTQGVISNYPLTASVVDAEHNIEEINYAWQTFLYHDTHNHPGSVDTNKITTTTISGEGCDGDYYAFRVKLTVTDAIGLSGSTDVWLYPNCTVVPPTALFTTSVSSGIAPLTVNFDASPSVNGGDTIVSYKWAFGDGTSGNGISVSKTYNVVGTYSARLIVKDNYNLRDTMNATIQVNNLSATEWNSYDMIMLSDSPHAYIPDAFDIGLPAYFHFYESADDEGTLFGNSLSVYNPDQHIEGYNKAENIWSFDYLYNAYPYVAKSTVSRGSDENETEAPFPSGVFDLQIFPPANAHNMVVAFKAPVTGNYSVKNISARRVSSIGSKTRFKVQKNGQVISSLLPLYDQKWLNDPDLHDLGTMNAGDEMYFTLNKKDYEFYDATEIAFTIAFTPIVCTTPTGLTASSITSSSAFLSWNNSGASSYTVTYKKVGGTSSVGTVSAGANEEINLTGLLPCATYKWQVKATCPGGSILRSAWGNFVTGGCKEGMPDEQSEMTLYPNPAMVKIHLEFPDEITISSIKISDAAGRIVAEDIFEGIHVTQTHEIDVTHVPPGVYFIKLISRDGSYFAQFAKQ